MIIGIYRNIYNPLKFYFNNKECLIYYLRD